MLRDFCLEGRPPRENFCKKQRRFTIKTLTLLLMITYKLLEINIQYKRWYNHI